MTTTTPNLVDIALQLETATSQLRVLSTFSEAQREAGVKKVVEEVKNQVTAVQDQMKKLGSEMQSLRDTTDNRMKAVEAGVHNDKIRQWHKQLCYQNDQLVPLRNCTTNEAIPDFPKTATEARCMSEPDSDRIVSALGWNLNMKPLRERREFILALMGFGGAGY